MGKKREKRGIRGLLGVLLMFSIFCFLPHSAQAAEVKQVCCNDRVRAVLMADGTLWMWGDNSYGQLGTGSTVNSSAPIKVMTGVKMVSLGLQHSAAVKTDGSLWTWGSNSSGE